MTPDDSQIPADAQASTVPVMAPLDALWRAARYLLSHPNRARDLDRIAATALEATGARAGALFVFDQRRGEMAVRAASGLEALAGRGAFLAQARGVAEWAARTKEFLRVDDSAADPRFPCHGAPAGRLMACRPLLRCTGPGSGLFPPRSRRTPTPKEPDLLAAQAGLLCRTAASSTNGGARVSDSNSSDARRTST
jgi:hypothetical protein